MRPNENISQVSVCTIMHLTRCIWILQQRVSSRCYSGGLSQTTLPGRFVKQKHIEDVVDLWNSQTLGLGNMLIHLSLLLFICSD